MSSLPDGYFDSDTAKQLRRLKRELVLALYLRCDEYWEAISDMRARWNIAPVVGLPPPTLSEASPEGWPEPPDSSEEAHKLRERWWFDLVAIRDRVVPEPYRDWQYFSLFWRKFFSTIVRKCKTT
jgi:hypothetical protein